jgi:plasmid stabilization system protein ParE
MVTKIVWRKKALRQLNETAEFLQNEYSLQTANNFVGKIMKSIERVSKNPDSYRKAPRTKSVYFINFDKHKQMFYRIEGKTLFISAFFDTRQDPSKRPF